MTMLRPIIVLALVAGMVAALVGLFQFNGPSPVSAQADNTAPTVSSLAITSDTGDDDTNFDDDGVYGIGDSIKVTVTFSESVSITGTPQLELDIGDGTGDAAEYESVAGSAVVFSYTVAEGDLDDDGIAIGANKLTLNSGSIKDAADNAANLSHDALSAQTGHKVDGVRPTISSVSLVSSTGGSDGVYTAGETITASVEFDEDVIVSGGPQLELDFEGTVKLADFSYADPKCEGPFCGFSPGPWAVRGIQLMFDYTVLSGDSDTDGAAVGANAVSLNGGAIKDAAGNDAVLTHDAVADDPGHKVSAVPLSPDNVRAVSQKRGEVKLTWKAPDNSRVTGHGIKRRLAGEDRSDQQRSDGSPRDQHTLVEDTGSADTDYTDESAEKGVEYEYQVSARNEAGAGEASGWVRAGPESASNSPATGAPTISGTAQVGETLTADTTGIADTDGLDNVSFSYQWLADDADIAGATGSTYTPVDGDEGKAIKVQVSFTDDAGNDETLTSPATDAVAAAPQPNIAITSDPDDDDSTFAFWYDEGVYGIGDDIEVTVTFNGNVTVTGSPRLELTIGSSAKNAAYKSANGSKVVFGYTVAVGDNDTDGIAIGSNKLTLNGGSIRDAADNAANLSHGALSAQSGHKVDGIRPTITYGPSFVYSTFSNDGVHTIGEYISADVRFSEEVIGIGVRNDGRPRLRIDMGGATRYARYHPLPINDWRDERLHFLYEVVKGDLDLDGISVAANSVELNGGTIRDAAGNDAVLTHSAVPADDNFIVDGVPPTVSSVTITSDPGDDDTYGVWDTIEVTVTFSEAVDIPQWGFTENGMTVTRMPRLELNIGGVAKSAKTHERENITGTAIVFRYTVQNGDNDSNGISISANKLTLNGGTIRDANGTSLVGGNPADLTHTAVADDADHKVDTTAGPQSADATLYGLTLRGIVLEHDYSYFYSGFRPAVVNYTASVAYSLAQTTVTATTRHSSATYAVKLDGVTDADGTVSLAVGSNVITVEVTAEDGETTRTYTITVTRVSSDASTDATLRRLVLSDVDYGTFLPNTTTYTAQVANDVSETLVTPYVSYQGASYVVKLGGVTDINRRISLAVGSNVITVEVTAEDLVTTKIYTITVTRAAVSAAAPDLVVSSVSIDSSTFGDPSFTLHATVRNQGSGSSDSTTLRYYISFDSTITSRDVEIGTDAVGGLAASGSSAESIDLIAPSAPGTFHYGACVDTLSDELETTNNCSSVAVSVNVADPNSLATGAPIINGTAQVGQTLTADTSGIADSDGLANVAYSYQWLADDTEIAGATGNTYALTSAELGKAIKVRVSFTDGAGNDETLTSTATEPIEAQADGQEGNSPATGLPTISGTAQVGETLTAGITGIADADGLSGESFTYQWVSGDGTTDTDIENATGATYKLVDADQGKAIKVRVTFTDGGGNEETLTSAPTGPVWGDGRPGAPRNLAATAGNKEVTLSWDPPADNGNAPATGYRIEWRVDGKDYDKTIWGTAGSTTYTTNVNANLANGVKYFFRVSAGNGSGNSYGPYGPASGEVSATPTSGSAVDLGTPVLSNTENLHHGMVRLDWQDVEDAGWYVVQYYHLDGGSGEWVDLPAEGVDVAFYGSSAVVSDLHGLSWLRVGAMSCGGESEWSQIEQLFGTNASDWEGVPVPEVAEGDEIEPCPVVLGTPVLSDTETLHHGMVRLDWEDIEDAGWYVVQYYHVKGGEWLDLPAEGVDIAFHGSSAVVSNLHGLSWLRVRAMSCAGESEWSQIEQLFGTNASDWEGVPVPEVAEGDEIEPCSEDADTSDNSPATGAPTIGGTAQVGETLEADTSGVTDADGLSNVQYEYQWLTDDSDISGATNATYTLVAGDEGKAIKVEVSFTDDAGNDETLTSAATVAVTATVPGAPQDVQVYLSGSSALGVSWEAPASDGGSFVTEYKVQWKSGEQDYDALHEATVYGPPGYKISGLTAGVLYTIRVIAMNNVGYGLPSSEVSDAPLSDLGLLRRFIATDVVEAHESSHPWLRTTWEYMKSEFDLEVSSSIRGGGSVEDGCSYEDGLQKCRAEVMKIGAASVNSLGVLLHEMAHVFTLTNGLLDEPAPLAAAHLYFYSLDMAEPLGHCRPGELLADILQLSVVGVSADRGAVGPIAFYWGFCNRDYEAGQADPLTEEALTVVRSALSGQMPQWFADTYHDSNGNADLEQLWSDVKSIRRGPLTGVCIWCFQLRDGRLSSAQPAGRAVAQEVTRPFCLSV